MGLEFIAHSGCRVPAPPSMAHCLRRGSQNSSRESWGEVSGRHNLPGRFFLLPVFLYLPWLLLKPSLPQRPLLPSRRPEPAWSWGVATAYGFFALGNSRGCWEGDKAHTGPCTFYIWNPVWNALRKCLCSAFCTLLGTHALVIDRHPMHYPWSCLRCSGPWVIPRSLKPKPTLLEPLDLPTFFRTSYAVG